MLFYVDKENTHPKYVGDSKYSYPCFVLFHDRWDDFGYKTQFDLYYYETINSYSQIGSIKIICKQLKDDKGGWTFDYLRESFEKLDSDWCSLGQNEEYYKNIKNLFNKDIASKLLNNLRDCSLDYSIVADFETKHSFSTSLLRTNDAEKMLRQGRLLINDEDLKCFFHVKFNFSPLYNTIQNVDINFNFENISDYYSRRIYCLIGENGVGKTQILSQFLEGANLYKKQFGKIIYLSNNYYEHLNFDEENEYIINCGLTEKKNDDVYIMNEVSLKKNIIENLKKLKKKYYNTSEQRYIDRFLGNISELFINVDFSELEGFNYSGDFEKFLSSFSILSSGESALLYNLINMLSNIRFNSLLLFDEPEVHLHPNFITKFMDFLYQMLKIFDSFAIICTHSTFIVREVKADSVYILNRIDNYCTVRKIKYESLGANAMTLANDIFENVEIQPFFQKEIKRMVHDGLSEEEIIKNLKSFEDMTLDIGINSWIHYMVKERNEKD